MDKITYLRQNWKNKGAEGAIPLDDDDLNHIEDGIYQATEGVNTLSDEVYDYKSSVYADLICENLTITASSQNRLAGIDLSKYAFLQIALKQSSSNEECWQPLGLIPTSGIYSMPLAVSLSEAYFTSPESDTSAAVQGLEEHFVHGSLTFTKNTKGDTIAFSPFLKSVLSPVTTYTTGTANHVYQKDRTVIESLQIQIIGIVMPFKTL